mmetsp:Transcript_2120/g.4479  ORF Transcript_2120/g.4479 Transcript_2120/m.4479 type:complete len:204 (+) Transcript_2120:135-746(+)
MLNAGLQIKQIALIAVMLASRASKIFDALIQTLFLIIRSLAPIWTTRSVVVLTVLHTFPQLISLLGQLLNPLLILLRQRNQIVRSTLLSDNLFNNLIDIANSGGLPNFAECSLIHVNRILLFLMCVVNTTAATMSPRAATTVLIVGRGCLLLLVLMILLLAFLLLLLLLSFNHLLTNLNKLMPFAKIPLPTGPLFFVVATNSM